MVPREIDLEEKRVYVPTPMIQEPFFSLPVDAAPKVPEIVTPAPSSVVVEPTIPDITVLLSVETHRRVATGNTKSREVAGALAGTAPSSTARNSVTRPEVL